MYIVHNLLSEQPYTSILPFLTYHRKPLTTVINKMYRYAPGSVASLRFLMIVMPCRFLLNWVKIDWILCCFLLYWCWRWVDYDSITFLHIAVHQLHHWLVGLRRGMFNYIVLPLPPCSVVANCPFDLFNSLSITFDGVLLLGCGVYWVNGKEN